MIYIDSSVALAYLLLEPRAPAQGFWDASIVSSRLLEYEIWNRLHAYGLADSQRDVAASLIGRLQLISPAPVVLARALRPFPIPVKTLDALHLATADHLQAQGAPLELASYDDRLAGAARALGIRLAAL